MTYSLENTFLERKMLSQCNFVVFYGKNIYCTSWAAVISIFSQMLRRTAALRTIKKRFFPLWREPLIKLQLISRPCMLRNVNILRKLKWFTPCLFKEACCGLVNNSGVPQTKRWFNVSCLRSLSWTVITTTRK